MDTVHTQANIQEELSRPRQLGHEPLFGRGIIQMLAALETGDAQEAISKLRATAATLVLNDTTGSWDRASAVTASRVLDALADAVGHQEDFAVFKRQHELKALAAHTKTSSVL